MTGSVPKRRLGILVAALLVVTTLLLLAQHRWLTQLSAEARARMSRDLRVGLRSGAERVDQGYMQLALALAGPGVEDEAGVASAWSAWAAGEPELASLVREVAGGAGSRTRVRGPRSEATGPALVLRLALPSASAEIVLDSAAAARQLPLRLREELAATVELQVHVALVRRRAGGSVAVLGSTGDLASQPAATAAVLALAGDSPGVFVLPGGGSDGRFSGPATWSTETDGGASGVPGLALHAWHAGGSLERVAGLLLRRNLAVAFSLTLLLAVAGVLLVIVAQRGERLAMARATLFSGVAHDVRTPLAVIRAAADNLGAGAVPADQAAAYGRMISAETDRLVSSVESTLGLARALGGADTLQRAPVNLDDVVRAAAGVAPGRIQVSSSGQPVVRGDRAALEALIGNLLANALAYAPPGEPVTVEVDGTARDSVLVVVRDRGPGIPRRERNFIFEPFRRGTSGRDSSHPGAGLGLALARHIAMVHGGSLTLGEPQAGAEFRLRLPAQS